MRLNTNPNISSAQTPAPPPSPAPVLAEKPKRIGDRILKAGFVVLVAHVCVRLSGLVLIKCTVNEYGLAVSDVFSWAYDVVLGTAYLVGEQCLGPAFLPVFTRAKSEEGEKRAWAYASIMFNLQFAVLLLFVLVLVLQPQMFMGATTQWDSNELKLRTTAGQTISGELLRHDGAGYTVRVAGQETFVPRATVEKADEIDKSIAGRLERRGMAPRMLSWVAPGLLGMSLGGLTYMILNGYKEFFFAAIGDAILKLSVLAGALLGAVFGQANWRFIAAGAIFGGTAKLLTHVLALGWRRIRMYSFSFNLRDPYLRIFLALVLPLLLGIFLARIRDAVMVNVLTSREGLVSYFKMGRAIIDTIGFFVPYTLSIALLPFFCDLSDRNDHQQLGDVLTRVVRMLVWFFVPVSVVLAVSALPLCLGLWEGKVIGVQQASYSALVLQLYCIQLPFVAIEMLVMQAFFSSRRMIAPTVAGFCFSICAALTAYSLVVVGGMTDTVQILVVVALSLVTARVLKSLVLVALLKWTVPVLPLGASLRFGGKLLLAGTGAAIVALGSSWCYHGPLAILPSTLSLIHSSIGHFAEAGLIATFGGVAFLGFSLLLRLEEPRLCWHWTREKLKGRTSASLAATAAPNGEI